MTALAEPMRLLLLTESRQWTVRLRAQLDAPGCAHGLVTAPSWAAASNLFDGARQGLLLCTPDFLPEPGRAG